MTCIARQTSLIPYDITVTEALDSWVFNIWLQSKLPWLPVAGWLSIFPFCLPQPEKRKYWLCGNSGWPMCSSQQYLEERHRSGVCDLWSSSTGMIILRLLLSLFCFCFLVAMKQVASLCQLLLPPLSTSSWIKSNRPSTQVPKCLKPWAKVQICPLELLCLRYIVTVAEISVAYLMIKPANIVFSTGCVRDLGEILQIESLCFSCLKIWYMPFGSSENWRKNQHVVPKNRVTNAHSQPRLYAFDTLPCFPIHSSSRRLFSSCRVF